MGGILQLGVPNGVRERLLRLHSGPRNTSGNAHHILVSARFDSRGSSAGEGCRFTGGSCCEPSKAAGSSTDKIYVGFAGLSSMRAYRQLPQDLRDTGTSTCLAVCKK